MTEKTIAEHIEPLLLISNPNYLCDGNIKFVKTDFIVYDRYFNGDFIEIFTTYLFEHNSLTERNYTHGRLYDVDYSINGLNLFERPIIEPTPIKFTLELMKQIDFEKQRSQHFKLVSIPTLKYRVLNFSMAYSKNVYDFSQTIAK